MNEQTVEQQIFNENVSKFEKELQELQIKHGIVIVPIITQSQHGIFPSITFGDKKTIDKKMEEIRGNSANG